MRDEIEVRKGWRFDSWSSGEHLATDFVNPHFSYTSGWRSSNSVEPAWKIKISLRSEMSEYPDNHLLLIEYPPSDENREFAENLKGDVRLDLLSLPVTAENANTWREVIHNLQRGDMPPEEEQPKAILR